jgi:hypothetical protein
MAKGRYLLFLSALFGVYTPIISKVSSKTVSIDINNETVIYVPGQSRVHETAISEVAIAVGVTKDALHVERIERVMEGSVFVGLLEDVEQKQRKELILSGMIDLHNVSKETDAFEVLMYDSILWVLGSNGRGMLQGVYELQEMLRAREVIGENFHRKGDFSSIPQRIFHPKFNGWPGSRADVRYISHLGASQCLVTHDWQGDLRHFQQYVKSEIFPEAMNKEQVEKKNRQLRELIENCKDYGLEVALWITEFPCQGGPWKPEAERQAFLTRYPDEVLSESGTYQGKVLCFGHPKVLAYYQEMIKGFFEDFPEISQLFVFGLDADGEFCDPKQCTRCQGMSKFSQRDRLLRFLIDEGGKIRPGLTVLSTSWGWQDKDSEEFLSRQRELPGKSGLFMAAASDGWQTERQSHEFLTAARQICAEKGQSFIGYDNLHWGDDTMHELRGIQDFPLGVAAKLARWDRLKVDGVFDHWGTFCEEISSNSIACRRFFLNPRADREAVCRDIADKQFGKKAGPMVFLSWQELENAQRILSNGCVYAPGQWPYWYSGREYPPVPDVIPRENYLRQGFKENMANGWIYNDGGEAGQNELIGEVWSRAWPFYQRAVDWMDKAIAQVDDGELFYAYWWSGEEKSPTRKEHLKQQKLYLESIGIVGHEIGLHFSLLSLYERLNGDHEKYRKEARDLLAEDAEASRACAEFLMRYAEAKETPQMKSWAEQYLKKAEVIDDYLQKSK